MLSRAFARIRVPLCAFLCLRMHARARGGRAFSCIRVHPCAFAHIRTGQLLIWSCVSRTHGLRTRIRIAFVYVCIQLRCIQMNSECQLVYACVCSERRECIGRRMCVYASRRECRTRIQRAFERIILMLHSCTF